MTTQIDLNKAWSETAAGTNAGATATHAVENDADGVNLNVTHIVTHVSGHVDEDATLQLKDGSTVLAEWKIDLAREAVKNAVIKVYGDKIKLVLEEPEEEKKNNADGTNILDSSIVKSALAMGAKIEEEKEG